MKIGKKIEVGVAEEQVRLLDLTQPKLSLSFAPLSWDEDDTARGDVFPSSCSFALAYIKSERHKRKMFKLYCTDKVFRLYLNLRFHSYDEFSRMAEGDVALTFIKKATNLTPNLFRIAAQNQGIEVPFFVDIEKYIALCGGEEKCKLNTQQSLLTLTEFRRRKAAMKSALEESKRNEHI